MILLCEDDQMRYYEFPVSKDEAIPFIFAIKLFSMTPTFLLAPGIISSRMYICIYIYIYV